MRYTAGGSSCIIPHASRNKYKPHATQGKDDAPPALLAYYQVYWLLAEHVEQRRSAVIDAGRVAKPS